MTEQTKPTRSKKPQTLGELSASISATRKALAKSAGVAPEKVNIEKLEAAVEKAKGDICAALGVPTHSIELDITTT